MTLLPTVLQGVGDMGQHAALGGDVEAADQLVLQVQQPAEHRQAVGYRVDADDRVACAVEQAVQRGGRHAAQIVGRVVGLQAHRQATRQADGVAESCDHAAFAGDRDQVLVAHQLGDPRHHLRGQPRRKGGQRGGVGVVGQQPVAEPAHRQVRHRGESGGVVGVDDQAGDVVRLVGHQRLGQEAFQRQVGQHVTRGHALLRGRRADAGEVIAGTCRTGRSHDMFQVIEYEDLPGDGGAIGH
jgi:hypothetical protein